MAADAESPTAIEIHLHTLEGRMEPLSVTRSDVTLEELQEPILRLFEKNIPTWVSLALEGEIFSNANGQSFLRDTAGDVLQAMFMKS